MTTRRATAPHSYRQAVRRPALIPYRRRDATEFGGGLLFGLLLIAGIVLWLSFGNPA